MARKVALVLIGVLLVMLAAAWFFTPLQSLVLSALRPEAPPTRGIEGPQAMDMLNTALNALNTLFGGAGLLLAVKGYRLSPPSR